MSIYGVNSMSPYSTAGGVNSAESEMAKKAKQDKTSNTKSTETAAATYKKSDATVKGKTDIATISKMKADTKQRAEQLRSLVEKMMKKQGMTYNQSTNMYALLRTGKLEVDASTAQQAKKDIAEEGYWGVNQTSDRLVSFAKALAGNDPSKADELMAAIEKGFKQATKSWGDKLPDICQQTLDATRQKMKDWKDGTETK